MVTFKEFFSFKNNRFFWLNLVAMIIVVIAIALGTLQWLDNYTRHGEAVVVPNVKGLPMRQAENEIYKQSLKAVAIDSSYVKGMPPGAILEQNPAGGSKVKKGRTATLKTGLQGVNDFSIYRSVFFKVSVPDIMDNSSLRQAEAKLRALGFRVTEPEYISGEKDWVYSVTYKGRTLNAGDKVPHEALLTLHVGNGNDELTNDSTLTDSTAIGDDDTPVVDKSWF